jgi:type II secretory pathway pseudopilin PulG
MLLPVLASVKKKALQKKAQLEAQDLVTAIQHYDSVYGRFPVTSGAQAAANGGDFTYGGTFLTPTGSTTVGTPVGGVGLISNNCDVVAILMDLANYPATGGATVNTNHQKNPQKIIFLTTKMSGWDPSQAGQPLPGVDKNLVFRDPWGNPYVISMDLNYDDNCEDDFYRISKVSKQTGSSGLNGLVNTADPTGNSDQFRFHGKVMVWSAGPDGKIDPLSPANSGVNKDNVVSW